MGHKSPLSRSIFGCILRLTKVCSEVRSALSAVSTKDVAM